MDFKIDLDGIKLNDLLLKEKNKVLNIAVILAAVLIAVNIYNAQTKTIAGIKNLKDIEFKKNDVISEISRYEKGIDSYKEFLIKKSTGAIINTINDIANECGVKIFSLKPSGAQDSSLYTKQPFDLSIAAPDYHAIGAFISKLESHSDIYIIDAINMRAAGEFTVNPAGEGPKTNNISVELRLSKISFKF